MSLPSLRPVAALLALSLAVIPVVAQEPPPDPADLGIELCGVADGLSLAGSPQATLYLAQTGLELGWKPSDPRLIQIRSLQELESWLADQAQESILYVALDARAPWETFQPLVDALAGRPAAILGRRDHDLLADALRLPSSQVVGKPAFVVTLRSDAREGTRFEVGKREIAGLERLLEHLATVREVLPEASITLAIDPAVPAGDAIPAARGLAALGFRSLRLSAASARETAGGGPGERAPEASIGAVQAGLIWLARHQEPEGSWSPDASDLRCHFPGCSGEGQAEFRTGVTGLSALAFLGAGYTHHSKDLIGGRAAGEIVGQALEWLVAHQDADGLITEQPCAKLVYNHAIATLAVCEAYGMTQDARYAEAARRAVDWLARAQNPGAGWRYSPRCGDNDMSVTGWCVMALESAQLGDIPVPESALAGALAYVESATDERGQVGYLSRADAGCKVVAMGKNEDYHNHPTMTAIGMLVRRFADPGSRDPEIERGAKHLVSDLPVWGEKHLSADFVYWYWASLALFQSDGPGSDGQKKYWKAWTAALPKALLPRQEAGRSCDAGSWDPVDRWGFEGGRAYATALNVLSLEIYYRYASVFPGKKK